MLEELRHLFLKNLHALRQVQPELADRVERRRPSPHFLWMASDSSAPTMQIEQGAHSLLLHSRRDPIQEAQRDVESLPLDIPAVFIILGLGLGYTIERLWEDHPRILTGLLIIERDIDIFYHFLHRRDWTALLTNPRVRFVVGKRPDAIVPAAHSLLPQIMGSGVRFVDHRPSSQLYSEFYSQVVENLRHFLQQAVAESEFLVHNGTLIQRNAILNLPAMCASHGLGPLRGFYKDQPAVLISAGPSLNKNLHELAAYRDRVVVFCVDTAYRIVRQHGIRPDFVAATDPTPLNEKHFEGIEPDPDVVLLFESDVFPNIPVNWAGPMIFINSEKAAVNRWIEEIAGPFGSFDQSLSVAHALYTAASWMGCNPIILAGYDLAYPLDATSTHAKGTVLNRALTKAKEGDSHIRVHGAPFHPADSQEEIVWVLGIRGGMAPTSKTMSVFLNKLSDTIQQTNQNVFDATEGGALIVGSIPTRFADILSSQEKKPVQSDILTFLEENRDEQDISRVKAFDALVHGLQQAVKVAQQGAILIHQLLPHASQVPNVAQVSSLPEWAKVDELFWTVYRSREVQIVLEQALFPTLFMFIRQETGETEKRRLEKYLQVFDSVIRLTYEFIPYILKSKQLIETTAQR